MADFEDKLGQIAANPASDIKQITDALADPTAMLSMNAARLRRNDLATENQVLEDARTMSPLDFHDTYGSDVASRLGQLNLGLNTYNRMNQDNRGFEQFVGDTTGDIASGLVQGVGNAAAFVGGMAHGPTGQAIVEATDYVTGGIQSLQSQEQTDAALLGSIRGELDRQDNDNQYQRDKEAGHSDFVAGLRHIGRGVIDGASRVTESSAGATELIAQGVGSMAAGGAVGKGLAAAGAAMGFATTTAQMMPAAIAALEGGGAFADTMKEVLGMSHEDLLQNSEDYRAMMQEGVPVDQAKLVLAYEAARIAGAMQATAGAVTGKMVAKFEAAPVAIGKSMREIGGDLVKETIEEGLQSGSAEFAKNVALQATADNTRTLLEGVGDSAGEGAVAGAGTAGVVQAPAGVQAVARKGVEKALDKVASIREADKAVSNGEFRQAGEIIDDVSDELAENIAAVEEETLAAVTENAPEDMEPEEIEDTKSAIKRAKIQMAEMSYLDEAEYASHGPEFIEALEGILEANQLDSLPTNRLGGVESAIVVLNDPEASDAAKRGAGNFLKSQMDRINDLADNVLPALLQNMKNVEAREGLEVFQRTLNNVRGNSIVTDALAQIESFAAEQVDPVAGPSDQQIQNTLMAAKVDPSRANPEVAQLLLSQKPSESPLTPSERQSLKSVVDMEKINTEYRANTGENENINVVSKNIFETSGDRAHKKSIVDHVKQINDMIASGDMTRAKNGFLSMRRFALTMANKVAAANQSLRQGGIPVAYESYGSGSKPLKTGTVAPITIHNNAGSHRFARTIHAEAKAVIQALKNLSDQHAFEVDIPTLEDLELDKSMTGAQATTRDAGTATNVTPRSDSEPSSTGDKPFRALRQPSSDQVRESVIRKVALKMKGNRVLLKDFTEEELDSLRHDYGAKVGRKYATLPQRTADYAIEQAPSEASKNEALKPKAPRPKKKAKGALVPKRVQTAFDKLRDQIIEAPKENFVTMKDKAPFRGVIRIDSVATEITQANLIDWVNANSDKFGLRIEKSGSKLNVLMTPDAYRGLKNGTLEMPGYVSNKPVATTESEAAPIVSSVGSQEDAPSAAEVETEVKVEAKPEVKEEVAEDPRGNSDPLPAPTAATEDTTAEPTKAEPTMESLFPRLQAPKDQDGQEKNFFKLAYKLAKKPVAFMDAKAPVREVEKVLNDLPNSGIKTALKTFMELVRDIGANANSKILKGADYEGKPLPIVAQAAQGKNTQRYLNGRAMALVEPTTAPSSTTGLTYNSNLLGKAALAAGHWFLNGNFSANVRDEDEFAASTGMTENNTRDFQEVMEAMNSGIDAGFAKRELADLIRKFWGVTPNNNVSASYTDGIAEAMAAEMIDAMAKEGVLEIKSLKIERDDAPNPVEMNIIVRSMQPNMDKLRGEIGGASEIFHEIILGEPENKNIGIGSKIIEIPNSVHRQSDSPLSKDQIDAIKEGNDTEYNLNDVNADFFESLGEEDSVYLFGGREFDPRIVNKEHRKTLEGKNQTLRFAYKEAKIMMDRLRSKAQADGVPVSSIPMYFAHTFNMVGRMMMLAGVNPQSSKLWRELFQPFKVTMDLTDAFQMNQFWKQVAQGLGNKTEHLYGSEIQAKMTKEFGPEGKYAEITLALENWLAEREDVGGPTPLPANFREMFKEAGISSYHGMSSVMAVARMNFHKAMGRDPKAFENWNYLEADGINHGPAGAIRKFMSLLKFSADYVKLLRMTGTFFGSKDTPLTMNKYKHGDNALDMYTFIKGLAEGRSSKKLQSMPKDVRDHRAAYLRLVSALGMDFEFDQEKGELKIGRKAVKNPVTVKIYGSGLNGVVAKVTDELIRSIYAHMTDVSEALERGENVMIGEGLKVNNVIYDKDQFNKDLFTVLNVSVEGRFNKDTGKMMYSLTENSQDIIEKSSKNMTGDDSLDIRNFKVIKEQRDALLTSSKLYFVSDVYGAMESSLSTYVSDATSAMQKASQVQSVVAEAVYLQEMRNLMKSRFNPREGEDVIPSDIPSRDEMKQIRKNTAPYMPTYTSDLATYDVSSREATVDLPEMKVKDRNGKERDVKMPKTVSSTLDGTLNSAPRISGPGQAGVKIIATTSIMGSDGFMQMFAHARNRRNGTHMQMSGVYDGMNIGLHDMNAASELVNASIKDAWLDNPVKPVLNGFEKFMGLSPVDVVQKLDADIRDQAMWYLSSWEQDKLAPDSMSSPEAVKLAIHETFSKLNTQSINIDVNLETMRRAQYWVDQMASAEAPHFNEGSVDVSGSSDAEIAQKLTALREQVAAEFSAKAKKPVKDTSKRFTEVFSIGRSVEFNGKNAVEIQASELPLLLDMVKMPKDLRALVDMALPRIPSGMRIITDAQNASDANYRGYYSAKDNLMVLAEVTPEVLAHELLHVATAAKINDYYAGKTGALTEYEKEAIRRLEGLMEELASRDTNTMSMEEQNNLGFFINSYANHDATALGRATAMHEFVSWVLTNPNMKSIAKRTSVKNSIYAWVGDALKAIKALIFGSKDVRVSDDLYSQVEFNTRILSERDYVGETDIGDLTATPLYASRIYGTNDRLIAVRERMSKAMTELVKKASGTSQSIKISQNHAAMMQAMGVSQDVLAAGFSMNQQEKSTFEYLVAALATDAELNPNGSMMISSLYDHVLENITMENFMVGADLNDQADVYQAQQKFDAIRGLKFKHTDVKGRTTLMPVFLGLAVTNEQFRDVLAKIKMPKSAESDAEATLDQVLENFGLSMMERLAHFTAGTGTAKNVQQAIDNLSMQLARTAKEDRSIFEQQSDSLFDKIDDLLAEQMEHGADYLKATGDKLKKSSNNLVKNAGKGIRTMAALLSQKHADEGAETALQSVALIKDKLTLTNFVRDLMGRTEGNAPVYDMISRARTVVDQMRQRYRVQLPELLKSKFKKAPSKGAWETMTKAFAKADISPIFAVLGLKDTVGLFEDGRTLAGYRGRLENEVMRLDPARGAAILTAARETAHYMMTGVSPAILRRNATTVSMLILSPQSVGQSYVSDLVPVVDQLISAYALGEMSQAEKDTLKDLITEERDGFEATMSVTADIQREELSKKANSLGALNHYKGFIRQASQEGVHLTVADRSQRKSLEMRGYKMVGKYDGHAADVTAHDMAYFYAPVSSRATYNQGVMQTVHQTYSGVDPVTGRTDGVLTAGIITDVHLVARITQRLRGNQQAYSEGLMPIVNELGQVVAYERSVDPKQLARVPRNENLAESLGAWRGRQQEELFAKTLNTELVFNLQKIWEEARNQGNKDQFVDLSKVSKKDNPVLAEAWDMIPNDAKQDIKNLFGADGFMIRRDMLDDAVGFRSASVGDFWTGNTRWSPETQKAIRNAAMSVFGKNAYTHLMNAESFLQDHVMEAKLLIVVKSIVVPGANLASNMYQLLMNGVPLRNVIKMVGKKTTEINEYIKLRDQEVKLEAEMMIARGKGRADLAQKIQTRIEHLHDTYKRMSIWPLVEAGEFSSISNGVPTQEDLSLANGNWTNYVRGLMNKAPEGLKTPVRYAMITRDTALFKAMATATQYGDFIAKAALYDHLVNTKGMTQQEAIMFVNEEFVNYNRSSGRMRDALERNGLLWFYHFKIRSVKVAARTLRRNPARALFGYAMAPDLPLLGPIGSPVWDNLISTYMEDGRWKASVGPGMGLRAPESHPWIALMS